MKKSDAIFLDSNVYINVLRSPEYEKKVERFLVSAYLYTLNKIVLMELWAGVRTPLEGQILKQHQKMCPRIGMQDDQFIHAGQLMMKMREKHRFEPKERRRMTWDLLIALSAMENRAIVITENKKDFERIQNWVDFEFVSV